MARSAGKRKKKKVKNGKAKKTVTQNVKVDSFFNFFQTLESDKQEKDQDAADATKNDNEDSGEESGNDIGEKMDQNFDLGTVFKEDLIPLALEYYLGVIDDDEEEDDEDNDDEGSDGDEKPKKKNKKTPVGPDGKECK